MQSKHCNQLTAAKGRERHVLAKMSYLKQHKENRSFPAPCLCVCARVCMHVYVCVRTCAAVLQQKWVRLLHCVAGPTQLMEVNLMLVVPPDAPQSLIRMLKITLRLFFGNKVRRAERQRCRTSATVTRLKNNRHNVTGLGCE